MNSRFFHLREAGGVIIEGLGEREEIVDLPPFLRIQHQTLHTRLHTVPFTDSLESFCTLKHQEHQIPASLDILYQNQL